MRTQLLTILSFIFLLPQMQAQFPDNFELLDHSKRISFPSAIANPGDSMIYVSNNQIWPNMTELLVARNDNTLDTLFSSPFSGKSKVVNNEDGSKDIFVYSLWDYDIGVPGFYVFHIDNNEIQIDTSNGNWQDPNYWYDFNYEIYHHDIIRDSMSRFWILTDRNVGRLDGDSLDIAVSTGNTHQNYFSQLFKNHIGDIFYKTDSTIFHVTDSALIPKFSFESPIEDIYTDSYGNYLLFEDSLLRFDAKFELLDKSWNLPPDLTQLNIFHSDSSQICIASVLMNNYNILCLNDDNEFELRFTDENEFEYPIDFHYLSDSNFIMAGTYRKENIFSCSFFRNVNFNQSVDYDRLQLEVSDFNLHRTGKDSTFSYVNSDGDSVYRFNYFFDYDLSYVNNSVTKIHFADIYSSEYFGVIGPGGPHFRHRLYDLDINMADGSSGSFDLFWFSNELINMKIAAPGANNKFNDSPMAVIVSDYTSSLYFPKLGLQDLEAFPNPCYDILNLESDQTLSRYFIYDNSGLLVQAGTVSGHQLDVSSLSSGMYFLIAEGKEDRFSVRFVKH